jgi:ABC-type amino acid transport substrate-binding protein
MEASSRCFDIWSVGCALGVGRLIQALSLIAGLACAGPAFARCEDVVPAQKPQNTFAQNVGRDFDRILDEGWIEFAVYEDFSPWSYMAEGKLVGIDIDIGTLIAKDLGVEAKFRAVQADETLEGDLRNYVWKGALVDGRVSDVMLHVPYDSVLKCRIEQVVFTGQYAVEALAIGYSDEAYPEDAPTPAYFRFDTVAVENDSISDFYLASIARGAVGQGITRFRTSQDAVAAMVAGETMAVMAPQAVIEERLVSGFSFHRPSFPGLVRSEWTIGIAVNQQHRDLGYAVDYAVEKAIVDGQIAAIFGQYGISYLPADR